MPPPAPPRTSPRAPQFGSLRAPTLVAALRERASRQPEGRIFTFLPQGEGEGEHLTFGELDRRARRIGGALAARGATGQRALLLHLPGLDFISAFFGCLYGRVTAVPLYPPDPARLGRTLPRFVSTVADSQSAVALTSKAILPFRDHLVSAAPELRRLRWIATDDLDDSEELASAPDVEPDSTMFLQYTSGSTATPKGVIVSHANFMSHYAFWSSGHGLDPARQILVSWLPTYHDLGLIVSVLMPILAGAPVVHLSPLDFLSRPLRWLEAVARFGATMSGAPNFAYDLCVRKTTETERAALDLSSWEVAFVGAEPTRFETLDRFARAFEPSGFRRNAFTPGYGLAEATLIVSARREHDRLVCHSVDRAELARGRVLEVPPDRPGAQRVMTCGRPMEDQRLLIVDSDSRTPRAQGEVGEVWVSSASVAQGYWNRPEETRKTFRAKLAAGGPEEFLRTGDLGYLWKGELFVTGRMKDLIIIRGRNYYPEDIELTVESSHASLRRGGGAAFSVDVEGEERLVLLQEIDAKAGHRAEEVIRKIRRDVAEVHELQAYAVALIAPGSLPKTSSGKIQRHASRENFLSGSAEVVAEHRLDDVEPGAASGLPPAEDAAEAHALRDSLRAARGEGRVEALLELLRREVARVAGLSVSEIDADVSAIGFGLDSLLAVELAERIERALHAHVPAEAFLDDRTLRALARELGDTGAGEALQPPPIARSSDPEPPPASFNQERRWRLDRLHAGSSIQNVHVTVRVRGALDADALERALGDVAQRHDAFRATLQEVGGRLVQRIAPSLEIALSRFDLSGLPESERREEARRIATRTSYTPFDLARGPLLRGSVVRLADDDHVVALAMHHAVFDDGSAAPFANELAALYRAHTLGEPHELAGPPIQYSDFARWQREWLQGDVLRRHTAYWRAQLAALPVLKLPYDHPEPERASFEGAWRQLALSPQLDRATRELCRREGVTPFMLVLAAVDTALHARTGQRDIPVAINVANRTRPETKHVIGDFSHHLLLRTRLEGDPRLREVLVSVRDVALGAYAHAHLPFERVAPPGSPVRESDAGAIFQVLLVFNRRPADLDLGELGIEPFPIENIRVKHDLQLSVNDGAGGIGGALGYRSERFRPETAARLADSFVRALEAIVSDPERRLSSLVRML